MAIVRKLALSGAQNQTRGRFMNHRVNAFLRMNPIALQKLKKCQLQVTEP